MTRLDDAMALAGWRYHKPSHGFVRDHHWVSYAQAEQALGAAEAGEAVVPEPTSRACAEAIAEVSNDNMRHLVITARPDDST